MITAILAFQFIGIGISPYLFQPARGTLSNPIPENSILTCVSTFSPPLPNITGTLTYNELENTFRKFISSWADTRHPHGHLLIVDDGSTYQYKQFLSNISASYSDVSLYLRPSNGGVSKAKNSCIRVFVDKGYSYLFLSDHDMFFNRRGWDRLYINTSLATGINHLSYFLSNGPAYASTYRGVPIANTPHVNGAFLFVTRKAIDIAGGFRVFPQKYGHEHSEFTLRMLYKKMMPAFFADVVGSEKYLTLQTRQSVIGEDSKVPQLAENHAFLLECLKGFNEKNFTKVPLIE